MATPQVGSSCVHPVAPSRVACGRTLAPPGKPPQVSRGHWKFFVETTPREWTSGPRRRRRVAHDRDVASSSRTFPTSSARILSASRVASSAISASGCRTVVSGRDGPPGRRGMSSNPTTDRSCGIVETDTGCRTGRPRAPAGRCPRRSRSAARGSARRRSASRSPSSLGELAFPDQLRVDRDARPPPVRTGTRRPGPGRTSVRPGPRSQRSRRWPSSIRCRVAASPPDQFVAPIDGHIRSRVARRVDHHEGDVPGLQLLPVLGRQTGEDQHRCERLAAEHAVDPFLARSRPDRRER